MRTESENAIGQNGNEWNLRVSQSKRVNGVLANAITGRSAAIRNPRASISGDLSSMAPPLELNSH